MFVISEHIQNELKDSKVFFDELQQVKAIQILKKIEIQYLDLSKKGCFIWEKFKSFECINDSKAWSYIKDFIGSSECIMFFNQDEEKKMYKLSSGEDLNYVLLETCGYEFYVTNENCDYVLCFNHHDTLFGCGLAMDWMRKLKEK